MIGGRVPFGSADPPHSRATVSACYYEKVEFGQFWATKKRTIGGQPDVFRLSSFVFYCFWLGFRFEKTAMVMGDSLGLIGKF